VSAAGGAPQPLTTLAKGEISHRLPHMLPGTAGVLFTVVRRPFSWSDSAIDVLPRRTGERKRLVEGAADARYLVSGHLAYVRDGLVFVAPFDPLQLELTGSPVGVLDDVMHAVHGQNRQLDTGAAQISFSDTGTIAYVSGGGYPHPTATMVWVDRRGRPTPLALPARNYLAARLSPDGTRVALMVRSPTQDIDIWMYDLQRSTFTRMGVRRIQLLSGVDARRRAPRVLEDGCRVAYPALDAGRRLRPT
jgi:serine/threonine-protein kinase